MRTITPTWPAVLQFDNDPELYLLQSAADWEQFCSDPANRLEKQDLLIDSRGECFFLETAASPIQPVHSGRRLLLEEFLGLLKAHLSAQGSCCVAKLYAPGFAEAFEMLTQACRIED